MVHAVTHNMFEHFLNNSKSNIMIIPERPLQVRERIDVHGEKFFFFFFFFDVGGKLCLKVGLC